MVWVSLEIGGLSATLRAELGYSVLESDGVQPIFSVLRDFECLFLIRKE